MSFFIVEIEFVSPDANNVSVMVEAGNELDARNAGWEFFNDEESPVAGVFAHPASEAEQERYAGLAI